MVIFMGYRTNGAGKSTFLKIISGEMDPTSGHIHLEPGKRMSVLNQNHNVFDEHTVLETVIMGNKTLFNQKKWTNYLDYNDKNADRIGELQVQFEEMSGWNADSDAASMLSNLGITEEHHYTLMEI
jgi:ATPase subunit of ABC transporter with duplicated ATPase domains